MRSKPLLSVLVGLLLTGFVNAQVAPATPYKKLPAGYENETLAALSYFPELETVPIKFKIRKSFSALKTRPSVASMFLPKGYRTYVIIISNKTIQPITPITFQNLSSDARIGVIGHELSHVLDFSKKSTWQCLKVAAKHLSTSYMDSLEYNTDRICIDHGLGQHLHSWSSFVRNAMNTTNWRGADFVLRGKMLRERYMNPETITKYMDAKTSLQVLQ